MSKNAGRMIQNRRAELGISLDQLAKLSKVTRSTITRIETGETASPSVLSIIQICYVLEISVEDIFIPGITHEEDEPVPAVPAPKSLWAVFKETLYRYFSAKFQLAAVQGGI